MHNPTAFLNRMRSLIAAAMVFVLLTGCMEENVPVGSLAPNATQGIDATDPTVSSTEPKPTETSPTEVTAPTQATEPLDPTDATQATTQTEGTTDCSHQYSSWSVTNAATCERSGEKVRTCSLCGEKQHETIAATGHKWNEGKTDGTLNSCADTAVCTYTCLNCGGTKRETVTGDHSFGDWEWEEYKYTIYFEPGSPEHFHAGPSVTYTSHRKFRTCTACNFVEKVNTPDHQCMRGAESHSTAEIKPADCNNGRLIRSTCSICGWYTDYYHGPVQHTLEFNTVVLSEYTEYTNEIHATFMKCTICGAEGISYRRVKTGDEGNKYRLSLSVSSGEADNISIQPDQYEALEHPEWQVVRRNFKYDEEGYVREFTVYWLYKGERYSQVINCEVDYILDWFDRVGLGGYGTKVNYQLKIYGEDIGPWKVSWTG